MSDEANCLPSFLAVHKAILARNVERIVKYELRRFKANTVLFFVNIVLNFIPGKQDCNSSNVTPLLYRL